MLGLYLPPVSKTVLRVRPPQNYYFAARPHSGKSVATSRCVSCAGRRPAVRIWVIPASCIKEGIDKIPPAPNDHFSAGPYGDMIKPPGWCVLGGTHSCPGVRIWIVSTPCVSERSSAPDDHFGPRPHCCMFGSSVRSVRGAGSCPRVRAWVVISRHCSGQNCCYPIRSSPYLSTLQCDCPGHQVDQRWLSMCLRYTRCRF